MRVLLTGAFGNIGAHAARSLIEQGHQVRLFDVRTPRAVRMAEALGSRADVVWGDIRDGEAVRTAVADREAVGHLAAIIPPAANERPAWARDITVGGTRNVIEAARACKGPVRLVYCSSIALFGKTQHLPPPRTATDPIQITDEYTAHKAECEQMVRESGLDWVILRMGACPPLSTLESSPSGRVNPMMFDVPLTDRIEFVHPLDAGLAVANALSCAEASGKTLLIGGGERCRLLQGEFLGRTLEAVGIGRFPDETFTTEPFHTDWLDTEESQRLLQFQRHGIEDYIRDTVAALGYRRWLIRLFRPFVRRAMLAQSAHWPQRRRHRET